MPLFQLSPLHGCQRVTNTPPREIPSQSRPGKLENANQQASLADACDGWHPVHARPREHADEEMCEGSHVPHCCIFSLFCIDGGAFMFGFLESASEMKCPQSIKKKYLRQERKSCPPQNVEYLLYLHFPYIPTFLPKSLK
jgi:hypothetical protein